MNILLVTPRFPYPTRTGDTLTVFHLLKHLSQRHAVDLVSCTTEPLPAAYRDAIRPFCRTLRTVPVSPARSFINGAGAVLRRQPLQAVWFSSPAVSAAGEEVAAGGASAGSSFRFETLHMNGQTPTPFSTIPQQGSEPIAICSSGVKK